MLDRYILAKLADFVDDLTGELDALNVAAACDAARGFLEVLSNWYIRRSRDRFWDGDPPARSPPSTPSTRCSKRPPGRWRRCCR